MLGVSWNFFHNYSVVHGERLETQLTFQTLKTDFTYVKGSFCYLFEFFQVIN